MGQGCPLLLLSTVYSRSYNYFIFYLTNDIEFGIIDKQNRIVFERIKMNHLSLYWWLSNTVSIIQSVDKTFFTLADDDRNEIVIYDDDDQLLFIQFCTSVKRLTTGLEIKRLCESEEHHEQN